MADNVTINSDTFVPMQAAPSQPPANTPNAPGVSIDSSTFQPITPATPPEAGGVTGLLNKIGERTGQALFGEESAMGAPTPEPFKTETTGAADIAKGNIAEGARKIYNAEIGSMHVVQGSPIEKLIQAFNPGFRGGITPTEAEKQHHENYAPIQQPLVNVKALAPETFNKKNHPAMTAIAEAASGLTSPENVAILYATGGMGLIESPKALGVANKLMSAGFSAQAIGDAYSRFKDFKTAYNNGDANEAIYNLTHLVLSGAMAVTAGSHAVGKEMPLAAPRDIEAMKAVASPVTGAIDKIQQMRAARERRAASTDLIEANRQFKQAIPPSRTAPYDENDLTVARNYLEPHHENVEPIRQVEHTVDALDHSIDGIEKKVAEHVKIIPNEPIATNVLSDVRSALEGNERGEEFVNAGMKEIEGLDLANVTMERADRVRRQLNLENKAILTKNNYDLEAARTADPGFAAREAAAESLRHGIYNQLEAHGIEGTRELRQEEGSLMRIRNAAYRQIFNGDKVVRGSGDTGIGRKLGQYGMTAGGMLAGGAAAGPIGAGVGALIGKEAGERILPAKDLTRDELIEQSFGKKVALGEPGDITVNLRKPPETPPTGQTEIPPPVPKPTPGSPEQPSLFGQTSPYPTPGRETVGRERTLLEQTLRPLRNIINDPTASAAQKAEAARQIANLPISELLNTPPTPPAGTTPEEVRKASLTELPYEVPNEKALEIPQQRLAPETEKGYKETSGKVLGHELGHALVAALEGFVPTGILSHFHEKLANFPTRAASTTFDLPDDMFDEAGHITEEKLRENDNFKKLLVTSMAGAAADEIHQGLSFKDNPGLVGDKRYAHRILDALGFSPEEKEVLIQEAFNRAKEHLSTPEAKSILLENRDVREPGLDSSMHFGKERLASISEELQRRLNERNNRGTTEQTSQLGKNDVAGREGKAAGQLASESTTGLKESTTGNQEVDNAIRQAGGIPAGNMAGLALYHDPRTGSTLAARPEETSVEQIRQNLADSRRSFGLPREANLPSESDRISTRVPSSKAATEDALSGEPLIVDRAAAGNDVKYNNKLADEVHDYPGVKTPDGMKDSGQVLNHFVNHIKENLKWLHNLSSPAERAANGRWYESANGLAKGEAVKYGIDDKQAAAAIAAQSPQKDWDQNVSLARRVMDIFHNKKDFTTTPEMVQKAQEIVTKSRKADPEANELLEKIVGNLVGKKFSDLTDPDEKAAWIRLYDETYNPREYHKIDPGTGKNLDVARNKDGSPTDVAWGSLTAIGNAISVLEDGSRENISKALGDNHKVRNFYNNIIDPTNNHDVTIDTHAVAAGQLRPLSGNSPEVKKNFGGITHGMTGLHGTYALYAEAYRQAAAELGLKPRELQSITWEKIRQLFPDTFKTAQNRAAEATGKTPIDKIWESYDNGKISLAQARQNILHEATVKPAPEVMPLKIQQPATLKPGITGHQALAGVL